MVSRFRQPRDKAVVAAEPALSASRMGEPQGICEELQ